MKKTALTKTHISLGAKMAEFAGYNMPISYNSINEEHYCVRNSVGVFDVSHMGEFLISGNGVNSAVYGWTDTGNGAVSSSEIFSLATLDNTDNDILSSSNFAFGTI